LWRNVSLYEFFIDCSMVQVVVSKITALTQRDIH